MQLHANRVNKRSHNRALCLCGSHFSNSVQLCQGDEIATLENSYTSTADNDVKISVVCNSDTADNVDLTADDFIFYIVVKENRFYPQCGMTIKGAVAYNDAAADKTVLTA